MRHIRSDGALRRFQSLRTAASLFVLLAQTMKTFFRSAASETSSQSGALLIPARWHVGTVTQLSDKVYTEERPAERAHSPEPTTLEVASVSNNS